VPEHLTLDSPLADLPRISDADERRLERLDLRTVRDLLFYLPFDWEAYGQPIPVSQLRLGQQATVMGTVGAIGAKRTSRRRMELTEALLIDSEGETLKVVWFNQPYLARQLRQGARLAVAGTVRAGRYGPGLEMQNPLHEVVGAEGPRRIGGLMPKYHLTAGLTSRKLAAMVEAAIPLAEQVEDSVPNPIRERHHLLPVAEAIRLGHQPTVQEAWQEARRRMAFAELLELQVAFLLARRRTAAERATPIPYQQPVIEAFKAGMDFELTHAQKRSIWEIFQDLTSETPMNRLLNGDVGSGKTAVAAAAIAMAHGAGMQSLVMAPTEILARQHLAKFRAYLERPFPDCRVELLVSGMPSSERRRARSAAAAGQCSLLVGTHALIEDDVELAHLGLAVVDEQHRFGTRQRELLRAKAGHGRPHFLALAMYGEMTLSVIDELPPGRRPVETRVVEPSQRERAYELVRQQVREGRQALIICPLIEESETLEVRAATKEFERLHQEVFPDFRLALLHGKVKDKDAVMGAFRDRESDILVATAVIEVGVDVPNATVMLIEGADRFGLAQLHQFRGRVGRASLRSYCLLLADDPSARSLSRLELMAATSDGFKLAGEDMRMRGAGELMGRRQHGMSDLAMEGLIRPHLLSEIRLEAEGLLREDPQLSSAPVLRQAAEQRLDQTSLS
jgi:ATP-dependent DNA helicase RecG